MFPWYNFVWQGQNSNPNHRINNSPNVNPNYNYHPNNTRTPYQFGQNRGYHSQFKYRPPSSRPNYIPKFVRNHNTNNIRVDVNKGAIKGNPPNKSTKQTQPVSPVKLHNFTPNQSGTKQSLLKNVDNNIQDNKANSTVNNMQIQGQDETSKRNEVKSATTDETANNNPIQNRNEAKEEKPPSTEKVLENESSVRDQISLDSKEQKKSTQKENASKDTENNKMKLEANAITKDVNNENGTSMRKKVNCELSKSKLEDVPSRAQTVVASTEEDAIELQATEFSTPFASNVKENSEMIDLNKDDGNFMSTEKDNTFLKTIRKSPADQKTVPVANKQSITEDSLSREHRTQYETNVKENTGITFEDKTLNLNFNATEKEAGCYINKDSCSIIKRSSTKSNIHELKTKQEHSSPTLVENYLEYKTDVNSKSIIENKKQPDKDNTIHETAQEHLAQQLNVITAIKQEQTGEYSETLDFTEIHNVKSEDLGTRGTIKRKRSNYFTEKDKNLHKKFTGNSPTTYRAKNTHMNTSEKSNRYHSPVFRSPRVSRDNFNYLPKSDLRKKFSKPAYDSDESVFIRRAKQYVKDNKVQYNSTKRNYRVKNSPSNPKHETLATKNLAINENQCKKTTKRLNNMDDEKQKYVEPKIKRTKISPIKFPESFENCQEINKERSFKDNNFDLRSKISKKNLNDIFSNLTHIDKNRNAAFKKDERLIIAFKNNIDDNEISEKINANNIFSKESKEDIPKIKLIKKVKSWKKHNNIKLEINVKYDGSSSSEEETSESQSTNNEDVSFLDDINIDDLIKYINDIAKDKAKKAEKKYRSPKKHLRCESKNQSETCSSDDSTETLLLSNFRCQKSDDENNAIVSKDKLFISDVNKCASCNMKSNSLPNTSTDEINDSKKREPQSSINIKEEVISIKSEASDLEMTDMIDLDSDEVESPCLHRENPPSSKLKQSDNAFDNVCLNSCKEKKYGDWNQMHTRVSEKENQEEFKEEPTEHDVALDKQYPVIDLTDQENSTQINSCNTLAYNEKNCIDDVELLEISDIKEELRENCESIEQINPVISNADTEQNNNSIHREINVSNSRGNQGNFTHSDSKSKNTEKYLEVSDIKEELTEKDEESLEKICAMIYGTSNENSIQNIISVIPTSSPVHSHICVNEYERKSVNNETNEIIKPSNTDYQNVLVSNTARSVCKTTENNKQSNKNEKELDRPLISQTMNEMINNCQDTITPSRTENNIEHDKVKHPEKPSLPQETRNSKIKILKVENITFNKVENNKTNVYCNNETSSNITGDLDEENCKTQKKDLLALLEEQMLVHLKGQCKIESLMHEGSFSKIYRCKNNKGTFFAAKITSGTFNSNKNGIWLQKGISEKNAHCVLLVKDFSLEKNWCFIMEYCPKNLEQVIRKNMVPFHVNLVQTLSRQLVGAVLYLKKNNIVHSDIKPSHILINDRNYELKLAGYDESYNVHYPRDYLDIGTTSYRAPELIMGHSAGFSVDVWSTALVIYEMATRKELFVGTNDNCVLYQQMCTLGHLPQDMIDKSIYKDVYFAKRTFLKESPNGTVLVYNFQNSDRLYSNIMQTSKRRINGKPLYSEQLNKFELLHEMLKKMLTLHPDHRLDIDAVCECAFFTQ